MDLHTLHIEHAALLGLYTILTLINSWAHPGSRGVRWFPLYNCCAFLGATVIVARPHMPTPLSIVLGDILFPIAYLVLHRCLTEFFGKGASGWQLQLALVLASLVVLIQSGVRHPNTRQRLLAYSIILAVQLAVSAVFVLRNATGSLRVSGGLMGMVLALISLNNVLRAGEVLAWGAPQNYLHAGSYLALSLVVLSVLQSGITVAFVWLTASALQDSLRQQASTDPLTGLLNRRGVQIAAERVIMAAQLSRQPLSAILVDLDNFKQVNDRLGHAAGDAALVAVARCLQAGMRRHDLLARLGGDEFVILLPDTAKERATEVAERLRQGVEQLFIPQEGGELRLGASFGLAEIASSVGDWEQLLNHCDKALYAGKEVGGNLVVAQ